MPLVVVSVVAMTFAAERLAPYWPQWNRHGPDFGADGLCTMALAGCMG